MPSIYEPINLGKKFGLFSEHWVPKIIAQMNEYQLKLVKIQGDFVWHRHADTDEVFIVIEGSMQIALRDGQVTLNPGEMFVVRKGVEHKPYASRECKLILIEPTGTVNTGDAGGVRAVQNDSWV
jgi:mannose-6-phosphate isomerase-like protein (cupin superfamily)